MGRTRPNRRGELVPVVAAGVVAALLVWGSVVAAARLAEKVVAPAGILVAAPVAAATAASTSTPTGLVGVDGFVVWESNRGGRWRLWRRDLAGGDAALLRPEAGPGRQCCPQISPDGELVAYVLLPPGPDRYADIEVGELRLVARDGSGDRVVRAVVRTYGENRAVVWRGNQQLVALDEAGRTIEIDLTDGSSTLLLGAGHATLGYLPAPDLAHATTGFPTFAPVVGGFVRERGLLGGCQPIFTPDSRAGVWAAGAGGPISRIDLVTREVTTVLAKNDVLLPAGQGYVYFPSLSPEANLLAVAASRDEHNHFSSDYDVFVLEVEPATLQPLGAAARITNDPATDRFPTVWSAPLALGRHEGEAPLPVVLELPGAASEWTVTVGGQPAAPALRGEVLQLEQPGRFDLVAARRGERLVGLAIVHEAAAPTIERVERRGDGLELVASEPLARPPRVLVGGQERVVELAAGGRLVWLAQLDAAPGQELVVEDLVDRAARPNTTAALRLEVPPPSWPAGAEGITYAWGAVGAAVGTGVERPAGAAPNELPVVATGLARFDRNFALQLHGEGAFVTPDTVATELLNGWRAANRVRLELVVEPALPRRPGPIVALSSGAGRGRRLLRLEETATGELELALTTAGDGPVLSRTQLGTLPASPSHWSLAWEPGRLRAWRDGALVLDSDAVQGDLFHWKPRPLQFGGEAASAEAWHGTIAAIAFGTGPLDNTLAAEAAARWLARAATQPAVAATRLRGRVVALAPVPRLDDISPYRDALRVVAIEVDRGPSVGAAGADAAGASAVGRVLVAERVLLDGGRLAAAERTVGSVVEFEVEPFGVQPQLAATYLAEGELGAPIWFVVAEPAR